MAKEKKTEQSLELDSAWQAAAKLYEKGGLVNLGSHPRYPQKVLTNRPSIDYVTDGGFPKGRMILIAGEPSSGKCLGKGTEVIMYDGTLKKVEDIVVGDLLMGIDSTPRLVCNLSSGIDDLYLVKQKKGINYVVNSNHLLYLQKRKKAAYSKVMKPNGKRGEDYSRLIREKSSEFVTARAQDVYNRRVSNPHAFRREFFGVRAENISYGKKELPLPPYLLGLWLGDGTNKKPQITNSDFEIDKYIEEYTEENNFSLLKTYRNNTTSFYISDVTQKGNRFYDPIKELDLRDNKHIPLIYLTSSLEDRLELLAGILDTDGNLSERDVEKGGFDIIQKSKRFAENIKQLAESCGLLCSNVSTEKKSIKNLNFTGTYYRLYIRGDLSIIPNKVERKRGSKSTPSYLSGLDIEYIGKGEYYGFELDGDSLFMLKDMTITHNSSLTIQAVDLVADKILYIDTEATLTTDYLDSLGVNPSKFFHSIPSSTEEMMNIVRREIPNFANNVIVIDSINNSASEEQIQKEAQERTMANRAIVMAAQLPIIIGLCNQYNVTLFILSQIRDNMNKKNPYSPDTVIPGGKSMHHNSSMTLELSPATKKKSKDSDELALYETITGRMVKISCTKNKVGKPFRTVEIEFTYGEGYTIEADTAAAAIRLGVLQMAGSWVKYNGENICQGKDNILPLLKDNPDLLEQLQKKVKEKVLSGVEEAEDKEIETLN